MAGLVKNCIQKVDKLSFPFTPPDPFLFVVYHKDLYPQGNERMEAPIRGDGMHFDPGADYRMYHGTTVPGFPQHPHRGFETLTATIEGVIDHADSLGNGGRYGGGDNQWMTAGKGIVHGEMFPLVNIDKPNTCRFFQIWLNLPAKNKMVEPDFKMHWAEEITIFKSDDSAQATVFADGSGLLGMKALPPPPNSWASDTNNEVAVWHIKINPGGSFSIPSARAGGEINRQLFWIEGKDLVINKSKVSMHAALKLDAGSEETVLRNRDEAEITEVLMLQGRPIKEPVAQHGPFVMNTQDEIQKAFSDYRATQFGGWPYKRDDHVYPRSEGRFALLNGKKEFPPAASGSEL